MAGIIIFWGLIVFIVGGIFFLIAAFRQSILWGIASILVPIIPLFFLCKALARGQKTIFGSSGRFRFDDYWHHPESDWNCTLV
jgi:hypothetical protein